MTDTTFFWLIGLLRSVGVAGLCNFGIGSPRKMPPFLAVLRYIAALLNPFGHGYAEKQGSLQTRNAVVWNVCKTLGAVIKPEQVLLLEGSKPAIRYILQALEFMGQVVLPMPYYPGNMDGVIGAGCQLLHLPMNTVKEFIRALETALKNGFRPVAVVLSFDNPRWLKRTKDDYVWLVELAKAYNFVLISDEAYRDLSYSGQVCSLMQVDGWEQVGVVIQTASKPFSAAGWKLGAVIGLTDTVKRIMTYRGRDSEGGSPAAQKAWETALRSCYRYPAKMAQYYKSQHDYTVRAFSEYPGLLEIQESYGGMFVYFKLLNGQTTEVVEKFKGLGFEVSPGERFGQPEMIRWCLNQPRWVTRRAVKVFCELLKKYPRNIHRRCTVIANF